MRKNHVGRWALWLALGWALTACQASPPPLPILRVGHAPHDHHTPLYVAASRPEYFRAHGGVYLEEVEPKVEYLLIQGDTRLARVVIDASTGGDELIRRLAEDQLDLALGGFPALLTQIDRGSPLRIIAPLMTGGNGLVLHRDLPATDWPGFVNLVRQSTTPVKIGYKTAGSVQDLLFEEILTRTGITHTRDLGDTRSQVLMVNLHGAANLIPALEAGLIDGFVVMQPFLAKAEAAGVGRLVGLLEDLAQVPGEAPLTYPCCALGAREDGLRRHATAIDGFVHLLRDATRYAAAQPDDTARLVAQWLGGTAAEEASSLATIHFLAEFDAAWQRGAAAWVERLGREGLLSPQSLAAARDDTLWNRVYDRGPLARAAMQTKP